MKEVESQRSGFLRRFVYFGEGERAEAHFTISRSLDPESSITLIEYGTAGAHVQFALSRNEVRSLITALDRVAPA